MKFFYKLTMHILRALGSGAAGAITGILCVPILALAWLFIFTVSISVLCFVYMGKGIEWAAKSINRLGA